MTRGRKRRVPANEVQQRYVPVNLPDDDLNAIRVIADLEKTSLGDLVAESIRARYGQALKKLQAVKQEIFLPTSEDKSSN